MFNVANKLAAIALVCAAAITALPALQSCGPDKNRVRAEQLVQEARQCVESDDNLRAVELLDTLDKACRDQVEIRKQGMAVRWQAMEAITADSIGIADAEIARLTLLVDSLAPRFRNVDQPGTAGFRVESSLYTGNEMKRTTVQPRIDESDYFFVIINRAGRAIGLQGISVGGVSATNARAVDMDGSELQTLRQEEVAALAQYIAAHPAQPLSVALLGSKGSDEVSFSPEQAAAFADTWTYARAMQDLRLALVQREKLERRLHRIRDNRANID